MIHLSISLLKYKVSLDSTDLKKKILKYFCLHGKSIDSGSLMFVRKPLTKGLKLYT